jgi:hypothetical protein
MGIWILATGVGLLLNRAALKFAFRASRPDSSILRGIGSRGEHTALALRYNDGGYWALPTWCSQAKVSPFILH